MTPDAPEPAARQKRLDDLRTVLTGLHPDTKPVVFGEGDPSAALVVVGEAPGAEEERALRPFVGAAGRLLSRLLSEAHLERGRIWITNVVKVRPTREVGGHRQNRPPDAAEVQTDLPILLRELEIIQPRAVVCLGNLAANSLIHKGFRMGEERGRWFSSSLGFRAIATYHPAFVLRFHGLERARFEDLMKHDLAAVREVVEARLNPLDAPQR